MATAVKRRSRYTNYSRVPYDAYDGSAARQLQREEVLRPRPMVRPRERAVVRPRVRVREAGLVSPFAVVGFLAVGVFAVLLLFSYVQLTTISQQVVELRSEMTALQSEEAKLRTAYELSYDLSSIEETMTASGAMVRPQNGQVVYVDLSEPDTVTFFNQDEAVAGLDGMFESVKSIASEIVAYFQCVRPYSDLQTPEKQTGCPGRPLKRTSREGVRKAIFLRPPAIYHPIPRGSGRRDFLSEVSQPWQTERESVWSSSSRTGGRTAPFWCAPCSC